jgi:hypothetical protein
VGFRNRIRGKWHSSCSSPVSVVVQRMPPRSDTVFSHLLDSGAHGAERSGMGRQRDMPTMEPNRGGGSLDGKLPRDVLACFLEASSPIYNFDLGVSMTRIRPKMGFLKSSAVRTRGEKYLPKAQTRPRWAVLGDLDVEFVMPIHQCRRSPKRRLSSSARWWYMMKLYKQKLKENSSVVMVMFLYDGNRWG